MRPFVLRRFREILLKSRLWASRRADVSLCTRNAARRRSSVEDEADQFPVGRKVHGYTVDKVTAIPELYLTAVQLSHDNTGATHLHLARDDPNNAFCVGFRTTPMDSTGAPHILEHTTLCGSHDYPCRDPFFKMLNRSLATFMNAFTGSDFTLYPFSTQNPRDFENLLSVYLDSVFRPLLREQDFLQEGWRLEHSTVDEPSSPIVFKGVVFNEMKGAMADSETLFAQSVQSHILPSHTYSYVSGGDPLSIPQLTWSQLKRFHGSHYHPSNARFLTYGDFCLEKHLEQIGARLAGFTRIAPSTAVPDETRWKRPREATITCCPDPLAPHPDRQTTVAVSYLWDRITDIEESFVLAVLSQLLIDGPNSPFYKSLLEPNLGCGYSPSSGYNNQTKQAIFSVGLRGVHCDDVGKVVDLVERTISDTIRNGFPEQRIEAVLHSIELGVKHQTSNFGLALIMALAAPWNHNADPARVLQINRLVDHFKEQLASKPRFLQNKLEQYLASNPHRLLLVMNADEEYESRRHASESQLLNDKLSSLAPEQLDEIYRQGVELRDTQNETNDASNFLPTLTVSDIGATIVPTILEQTSTGSVPLQLTAQPTNGLLYFRAVLNCRDLPSELKPLLPTFCNVVTNMGTEDLDYKEFAQKVELKTGGLSVSPLVVENPARDDFYEEGISLYSHCLQKNAEEMLSLWTQLFVGANLLNTDRLRTLLNDMAADAASGLPHAGHSYAMTRAASTLNPVTALKETFQGLEQIQVLKKLAGTEDLAQLVLQLQSIAKHLLTKNNLRLAVNSTEEFVPKVRYLLHDFVASIPGNPAGSSVTSQDDRFRTTSRKQHVVLPLPVNFVSRCVPTVRLHHQDFASLRILARLLTTKFLHREIREKGGAYGGGATAASSGIFAFYSYRDPRSFETFEAFDAAVNWAKQEQFVERDIDEAKLSVFSEVDAPIAPGDKGKSLFLNGVSDEMKQEHRVKLLKVKAKDVVQVAERYLSAPRHSSDVVLGPEAARGGDLHWEVLRNDFVSED